MSKKTSLNDFTPLLVVGGIALIGYLAFNKIGDFVGGAAGAVGEAVNTVNPFYHINKKIEADTQAAKENLIKTYTEKGITISKDIAPNVTDYGGVSSTVKAASIALGNMQVDLLKDKGIDVTKPKPATKKPIDTATRVSITKQPVTAKIMRSNIPTDIKQKISLIKRK